MSDNSILIAKAVGGVPLDDFPIYDVHTHIDPGLGMAVLGSTAEDLVDQMNRLGIRSACVSSIPAIYGMTQLGNDSVIAAQMEHPSRIRGYMALNPIAPDVLIEMERCHSAGLAGLKIYSSSSIAGLPYDHPTYMPIYDLADQWALPVLVHTWGRPDLDRLESAISRCKNITWLLAHTGAQHIERYLEITRKYPNAFLELCLSTCPRGLVEFLVREVGDERVIWGSDQMFFDAAHQLGRVVFAQISYESKCRILGGNARRLLPGMLGDSE